MLSLALWRVDGRAPTSSALMAVVALRLRAHALRNSRRRRAHSAAPAPTLAPAAPPAAVTVVQDERGAAALVAALFRLPAHTVVAWDSETHGVDAARQSPVGNGRLLCLTAYAGHHVDFGSGPRLFVDCVQPRVLRALRPYFESAARPKVWHNYAFDRHVLANHGVVPRGFAADTMHMARLVDSSLHKYSLQALCDRFLPDDPQLTKLSIDHLFAHHLPPRTKPALQTLAIHNNPHLRHQWIHYACLDAELTHRLYHRLRTELCATRIHATNAPAQIPHRFPTLHHLYHHLLRPFGQLLTDVERRGFKVDVRRLQHAAERAAADQLRLEDCFRDWAKTHSPDAAYMNLHSDLQKQHFFFAPCKNSLHPSRSMPPRKSFERVLHAHLRHRYLQQLRHSNDHQHQQLYQTYAQCESKKVKCDIVLHGLANKPVQYTATGWPSVSAAALAKLAKKSAAKSDQHHQRMSRAIAHLLDATAIASLMSGFILPLQQWPAADGRIHPSLNLNTETGRLSSRRPNLQNQPALEKDRYQIRSAFVPEPGNALIVADYAQLELRLLAHVTRCKSMIDAFRAGGDFHSRTALTMFDHVRAAVQQRKCVLESTTSQPTDEAHLPLLKDMFPVERRKAKTLNFSIAYGKTIVGLARDWNTTEEDAAQTLNLWYRERQEVRQWQRRCKQFLREHRFVETITGRRRHLPQIASDNMHERYHAQRAAINAPLQGSAADLVMGAMLKLHRDRVLRALGWHIVLQVHDEIILEGPRESAHVALPIVVQKMKNPLDIELLVDLTVDAKCAKSWYDAK